MNYIKPSMNITLFDAESVVTDVSQTQFGNMTNGMYTGQVSYNELSDKKEEIFEFKK